MFRAAVLFLASFLLLTCKDSPVNPVGSPPLVVLKGPNVVVVIPPPTPHVFGPVEFVRELGKPELRVYTFSTEGHQAPFILHVRNGDSNGENRVSSSWMEIDGVRILEQSDFSNQVSEHALEVQLMEPSSTLRVTVAGTPGEVLRYWITDATQAFVVGPEGGTFSALQGNVVFTLPTGAVSEETLLTVEPEGSASDGTSPLSSYEFGPEGTEFLRPITVTLSYDPALLPVEGTEEIVALALEENGLWEIIDESTVDTEANTVSAEVSHFSKIGALTKAGFCPGAGGSKNFDTFQEALAAIVPGGTIEICAGTHAVEDAHIDKPVIVEPKAGTNPTVNNGADNNMFWVDGVPIGTVVFRDFTLSSTANTILKMGAPDGTGFHDLVLVENMDFFSEGSGGIGAYPTANPDATVVVESSTFTGGAFAVWAQSGNRLEVSSSTFVGTRYGVYPGDNTELEIYSSTFTNQGQSAVIAGEGASGRIEGNTIEGCGAASCINVWGTGELWIVGNQMTSDASDATSGTQIGIWVELLGGENHVLGNTIIGTDSLGTGRRGFSRAGLLVETEARVVKASNNIIQGAEAGMEARDGGIIEGGTDNVISNVQMGLVLVNWPEDVPHRSTLTINRSDISDYVEAVAGGAWEEGEMNATCNWWGTPTGPPEHVNYPTSLLLPYSNVPIAGNPSVPCSTGGFLPTARFCSYDPDAFRSLTVALYAVEPGGTVQVCDGSHAIKDVPVNKPVTIEPEPDASPTLVISEGEGLWINGVPSGTVHINHLAFQNDASNSSSSVWAGQREDPSLYDQVIVEGCSFVSVHGVFAVGAHGTTVPGGKMQVSGSTFNGGSIATFAVAGAQIDVLDSNISGQTFSGIQIQERGWGRIEGNTVSQCGPYGCIRGAHPGPLEIVNNVILGEGGDGVRAGILLWDWTTALISGNEITGTPGPGPSDYPFPEGGIHLFPAEPWNMPAVTGPNRAWIDGNAISGVDRGIWANQSFVEWATGNTITDVKAGLWIENEGNIQGFEGNLISNAGTGIHVDTDAAFTGWDNVLTGFHSIDGEGGFALDPYGNSIFVLNRSDITDYDAVFGPGWPDEGIHPGDLICNWWGDAAGPGAIGGDPSIYTPWATVPIAGNTGVDCPVPAPAPVADLAAALVNAVSFEQFLPPSLRANPRS